MRNLLFTLAFSLLFLTVKAQTEITTRKNIVFFELGGIAPYYSINYERTVLQKEKIFLSLRGGASVLPKLFSIPIGIQLVTGRSEHHAEFSLGLTPYIEYHRPLFHSNNFSDKMLYVVPGVAYRYHKPAGRFFFTAGLCPLFQLDPPSHDFWDISTAFFPSGKLAAGIRF